MKGLVAFCLVLLIAVASCEEFRAEWCKNVPKGQCSGMMCNKAGTSAKGVGCGEVHCKEYVSRGEVDPSKPFPECCPKPVCKN